MSLFSRKNQPPLGEQELKFHIPGISSEGLRGWLDAVFQPHKRHFASTICSIYFDTPGRKSFHEKEASDYRKTKYRVRWYADEAGKALDGPAYLEIKEKHGSARRKQRIALPVPAREIAQTPLTDSSLTRFFREGVDEVISAPGLDLRPVLELRYNRRRYTHSVFPETFCLDSKIRLARTHPAYLPAPDGRCLDHCIFEQKGAAEHPQPVLQPLPRFGARRAALSKYQLTILQLQPDAEYA